MKQVLKEQPRSKEQWCEECKKRGVAQATFYYHFKIMKSNNEIKYLTNKKVFQLIERDLADTEEIQLYIDQIKSPNTKLRDIGTTELITLCKSHIVTHDSSLLRFIETALIDASYHDIHVKLLQAFRYILIRCISDEQEDITTKLLEQNKTALLNFIQAGSLPLQRTALSTLNLRPTKETFKHLCDLIETKQPEEYQYLKGVILDGLRSHINEYKVEVKRKLFAIATTNTSEEINNRAIDLLGELTGLKETFIA